MKTSRDKNGYFELSIASYVIDYQLVVSFLFPLLKAEKIF